MNWNSKIQSIINKKDNSPELKRGEIKKILITEIQQEIPQFKFLKYKNCCCTFESIKFFKGFAVHEQFHIIFKLKDKNISCSIASRISRKYLSDNFYNTRILNPDYALDFVMREKRARKMKKHGNFLPQM